MQFDIIKARLTIKLFFVLDSMRGIPIKSINTPKLNSILAVKHKLEPLSPGKSPKIIKVIGKFRLCHEVNIQEYTELFG